VFFATKSLLGWPGVGRLPSKFQLLWVRVREPDPKSSHSGAIYLWVEDVDENNIPTGVPRAYELPYSRLLADRSLKARDEIMAGKPQAGSSAGLEDDEAARAEAPEQKPLGAQNPTEHGVSGLDIEQLQQAAHVQFGPLPVPKLPPKIP
jgi:hypothetical protein